MRSAKSVFVDANGEVGVPEPGKSPMITVSPRPSESSWEICAEATSRRKKHAGRQDYAPVCAGRDYHSRWGWAALAAG
jgi:hypothetical protein